MSISSSAFSLPRRLPLAASLAALFGLTFSAAEAGPVQRLMQLSGHRSAIVPADPMRFANIGSVLKSGGPPPGNPSATVHHVTSCTDDPNDPGSLRNIVASPSTVSGDHIDFAQLPMACSTISLNQGEAIKVYQNNLYLDGPGAGALTIDANAASTALYHFGAGTLYVSDLTVAYGYFSSAVGTKGGCIYSLASVFLFEADVNGCTVMSTDANSPAEGGGVYAHGNLTLVRSTISNSRAVTINGAASIGGGAYVRGSFFSNDSTIRGNSAEPLGSALTTAGGIWILGGQAHIDDSTISGNSADYVGGVGVFLQDSLIINSTISGNLGGLAYGGIWTSAPLTIANSTIAFNRAPSSGSGGGLFSDGSLLTLQSSIIADNVISQNGSDLGGSGAQVTGDRNLVARSDLQLPFNNMVGVCPKLDPLLDNGGLTRTHGLNHASIAIDNGDAGNTTLDQRGAPRPTGIAADIGALERQAADVDERILASNFDGLCDF